MVYHVLQGEEMPGMVKSSVPEVFSTAAIAAVQGGKGELEGESEIEGSHRSIAGNV